MKKMQKKSKKMPKLGQKNVILDKITSESDEIASNYWKKAEKDRAESYKEWLKSLKKARIEAERLYK
jgi:hypothetical protein